MILLSAAALVRIGHRRGSSWWNDDPRSSDYVSLFDSGFDAWSRSWAAGSSGSNMGSVYDGTYWFLSEPR